jgi:hypothetical protein
MAAQNANNDSHFCTSPSPEGLLGHGWAQILQVELERAGPSLSLPSRRMVVNLRFIDPPMLLRQWQVQGTLF